MSETKQVMKVETEQSIVKITKEDVKRLLCPSASDVEIVLFLKIAQSYNLNPFKREIHLIPFKDPKSNTIKHQTVVGYESYIKRAERTGQLDGWKVSVNGDKATITIKRKDFSEPFIWEVDKKEFDRGFSSWAKMPNFMLKKVAIAQGFRLAFSEELGGMPYIPEEISETQSTENLKTEPVEVEGEILNEETGEILEQTEEEKPQAEKISEKQAKRFYAIAKSKGYTDNEIKKWLKDKYKIEHTRDILKDYYEDLCNDFEHNLVPKEKPPEDY